MQTSDKKLFSVFELYRIMTLAFRSIPLLKRAKAAGEMDKPFLERIMLAVTEVNGCAMCSYYHTRVALEEGFSKEEIRAMLGGDFADVPEEQLGGVLFAQHYADLRGKPTQESWRRIVDQYGRTGAYGILAVTRMIMMGNATGIPAGSFINRFRGKADPRSNVAYELLMMLAMLVFLPLTGLSALVLNWVKTPIIHF
ncbi:MAG: carboxymuconolactone decarboxylase family protein [Clostridiales bacterium]|nr:carboxymuconolactone decarboxylase family protein [Clostridiales bacterium]